MTVLVTRRLFYRPKPGTRASSVRSISLRVLALVPLIENTLSAWFYTSVFDINIEALLEGW